MWLIHVHSKLCVFKIEEVTSSMIWSIHYGSGSRNLESRGHNTWPRPQSACFHLQELSRVHAETKVESGDEATQY